MIQAQKANGDKEQRWQDMAAKLSQVTDKLGQPIDPGILEMVIVLNLLGIHTVASCEGHLDWGTGAPWVELEAAGVTQADEVSLRFEEAVQARARGTPPEEWQAMFAEAHRLRLQVKAAHLVERRKLLYQLAAFYHGRSVPFDVRLVLQSASMLGRSRLESQGADFQDMLPPEERAEHLKRYQDEMTAFTTFLKRQYFTENDVSEKGQHNDY